MFRKIDAVRPGPVVRADRRGIGIAVDSGERAVDVADRRRQRLRFVDTLKKGDRAARKVSGRAPAFGRLGHGVKIRPNRFDRLELRAVQTSVAIENYFDGNDAAEPIDRSDILREFLFRELDARQAPILAEKRKYVPLRAFKKASGLRERFERILLARGEVVEVGIRHDFRIDARIERENAVGIAGAEPFRENGERFVAVPDPRIGAVDPPAFDFRSVPLPVFRDDVGPILHILFRDGHGPLESGERLRIFCRAVARPVEIQIDSARFERVGDLHNEVALRTRFARLIAREAVERRVRRAKVFVLLHHGKEDVSRARLRDLIREPLHVEFVDAFVPARLLAEAVDRFGVVLQSGKVMKEEAKSLGAEPFGSGGIRRAVRRRAVGNLGVAYLPGGQREKQNGGGEF